MLSTWIENLLPGLRTLRPPLVSGLLWVLFLWILLVEWIPHPDEAVGWFQQAYAVARAAGHVLVAIVASVLTWAIGAMSMAATDALGSVVGRIALVFDWHMRAQWAKFRLHRRVRALDRARGRLMSLESDEPDTELERIEKQLGKLRKQLEDVRRASGWIRITDESKTRRALGLLPSNEGLELEIAVVKQAARVALDTAIKERGLDVSSEEIHLSPATFEVAEQLREEFERDPLDALRSLDEPLFLELDRERSEREVRLAMSVPIFIFGIVGSVAWSKWYILVATLGGLLLIQAARAQTAERRRILNLVRLKGLDTPALRSAAACGRDALRAHLGEAQATSQGS